LDKLVDSRSEPLWYVVSPGWAITAGNLLINSNTIGQLNVDGQANAAVALIIAPGAAMNVAASAGCTARNQARSAPAPTMDARDYIECFNTGTSTFATTGPTTSFNDQVVRITAADVMPGIEAAIASRVEREIAPLLRGVYATNSWGANVSAGNPVYPFAAPFADPSLTASYQGSSASCAGGVCKGLLPVMFSSAPGTSTPCTPSAGSPCDPTFVRWVSPPAPVFARTGGAALGPPAPTCSVLAASVDCTIFASGPLVGLPAPMTFTLAATANKVGMALRKFDTTVAMTGIDPAGRSIVSAPMASDGSARVAINGSARPSGTLADYLEFGNAAGNFERQPVSTAVDAAVKKPFNDRIVVVDVNP